MASSLKNQSSSVTSTTSDDPGVKLPPHKFVSQCNPDGLIYQCEQLSLDKAQEVVVPSNKFFSTKNNWNKADPSKKQKENSFSIRRSSPSPTVPSSAPEHPPRIFKYEPHTVLREDIDLPKATYAQRGANDYDFVPDKALPQKPKNLYEEIHLQTQPFTSPALRKHASDRAGTVTAFCLHNLLSPKECHLLINTAEPHIHCVSDTFVQSYRKASRALLSLPKVGDEIFRRICPQLYPTDYHDRIPLCFGQSGVWIPWKLNDCFKVTRCDGSFHWHRDGPWVPREDQASLYTVLIYLTEEFEGGYTSLRVDPPLGQRTTVFGGSSDSLNVIPCTGTALLFNHDILHSGFSVKGGASDDFSSEAKWVARTELIMQRVHSYHVDKYRFTKEDKYQLCLEKYVASQEAMIQGERSDFVELYQQVVLLQQEAMRETIQERGGGGSGKSNNSSSSSSSFISEELNADAFADILNYLSVQDCVTLLRVSRTTFGKVIQSDTWRLRLEREYPNTVRFRSPWDHFFGSSSTMGENTNGEKGKMEEEARLSTMFQSLFVDHSTTATSSSSLGVEADCAKKTVYQARYSEEAQNYAKKNILLFPSSSSSPQEKNDDSYNQQDRSSSSSFPQPLLQSTPEAVSNLEHSCGGSTSTTGMAVVEALLPSPPANQTTPQESTTEENPTPTPTANHFLEFDWFTLYVQRRTLSKRFMPFALWPRRFDKTLLLKDPAHHRSTLFTYGPIGDGPELISAPSQKPEEITWQYKSDKGDKFITFPADFQDAVEALYEEAKEGGELLQAATYRGRSYKLDFKEMTQTNTDTNTQREIKRLKVSATLKSKDGALDNNNLTIYALPHFFGDPEYAYPLHLNMPDSLRFLVKHRPGPRNGLEAPTCCAIHLRDHPNLGQAPNEEEDKTESCFTQAEAEHSYGRRRNELSKERWNDLEWSVLRAPINKCVDPTYHPMLLIGLPQWWVAPRTQSTTTTTTTTTSTTVAGSSGGKTALESSYAAVMETVRDAFESLRVPAIRIVHPAVAGVAGHLAKIKHLQRSRADLPHPSAALVAVISVIFPAPPLSSTTVPCCYLAIIDIIDLAVKVSVPLKNLADVNDDPAVGKLLDVSSYETEIESHAVVGENKTADTNTTTTASSGKLQIFVQNIDGNTETWRRFVRATCGSVLSSSPSSQRQQQNDGFQLLEDSETIAGIEALVGSLDFREKCVFRPVR